MRADDLENFFHPDLRRVIRAAAVSLHPATKHLMEGVARYSEVFGYDADLEAKIAKTERSVFLGVAELGPLQGREIWLPANMLTNHLLTVGSTGSGKSTTDMSIVLQTQRLGIPNWAFDSKGGLTPLAVYAGFLYVKLSEFPFNILRPPKGVRGYSSIVSSGFASALELGSVGQLLMTQTLNALYERVAALDPTKDAPSVFELYAAFADAVRDRSYKEQAEIHPLVRDASRVGGVIMGNLGQAISYYNGVALEELIGKDVLFDCRGLSRDEAHLVVGLLSAGAAAHLIQNERFSSQLERFVLYDDMDEIVFRNVGVSGIDLFSELHSKVRATGTGEGFSSHTWLGMNQMKIKNDSACYLMSRMNNAVDAAAMIRAMGGDMSLMQDVLTLEPGRMLVKIAGTEAPIFVRTPMPDIPLDVTQEQLKEAQERTKEFIRQFDVMPVAEQDRQLVHGQILRERNAPRSAEQVIDQKIRLREERIKEIVQAVSRNPGITANELKGRLKWASSNAMFNEVVDEGLNQDYLVAVKRYFKKGESGRPGMRFGLTPKGYALIGEKGEGKGHIQRMFVASVRLAFEKDGLTVKGERFADRADLYVHRGDGKLHVVIEISITTTTEHTVSQIHRMLEQEKVPAILVIAVQLIVEQDRKNVYVSNRKAEEKKADVLRSAIAQEFPNDTQIVVKTFEEFRLDEG